MAKQGACKGGRQGSAMFVPLLRLPPDILLVIDGLARNTFYRFRV